MEQIMNETEILAFDYFKAFGFDDKQIAQLIMQGKKDLHKELKKLKILLHTDTISYTDINNVLHSLKGLLFQLGNHTVSDKLNEVGLQNESDIRLKEIALLLHL